jgi:hypothetical protein
MSERPSLDRIMVKGDLIITAATSNGEQAISVTGTKLTIFLSSNSHCNSLTGQTKYIVNCGCYKDILTLYSPSRVLSDPI